MRNLHCLDQYRDVSADTFRTFGYFGDHECGRFFLPSPVAGRTLCVIAASGEGWDHVSVSLKGSTRTPTWEEMCRIKELFFEDNETVMQLHVPRADHVNYHPGCLHLWRPHHTPIPRPDALMVGPLPDAPPQSPEPV